MARSGILFILPNGSIFAAPVREAHVLVDKNLATWGTYEDSEGRWGKRLYRPAIYLNDKAAEYVRRWRNPLHACWPDSLQSSAC